MRLNERRHMCPFPLQQRSARKPVLSARMGAQILVFEGRIFWHGKKGAGAGNGRDGASDFFNLQRPAVTAFVIAILSLWYVNSALI